MSVVRQNTICHWINCLYSQQHPIRSFWGCVRSQSVEYNADISQHHFKTMGDSCRVQTSQVALIIWQLGMLKSCMRMHGTVLSQLVASQPQL